MLRMESSIWRKWFRMNESAVQHILWEWSSISFPASESSLFPGSDHVMDRCCCWWGLTLPSIRFTYRTQWMISRKEASHNNLVVILSHSPCDTEVLATHESKGGHLCLPSISWLVDFISLSNSGKGIGADIEIMMTWKRAKCNYCLQALKGWVIRKTSCNNMLLHEASQLPDVFQSFHGLRPEKWPFLLSGSRRLQWAAWPLRQCSNYFFNGAVVTHEVNILLVMCKSLQNRTGCQKLHKDHKAGRNAAAKSLNTTANEEVWVTTKTSNQLPEKKKRRESKGRPIRITGHGTILSLMRFTCHVPVLLLCNNALFLQTLSLFQVANMWSSPDQLC
jgi:hypothetical protein